MKKLEPREIAFGGLSTALVIICLYLGTIIRNNRISFIALATFIASVPYITGSILLGALSYFVSVILSFLLIPSKEYALFYLFLGIYPLIKLISEGYGVIKEYIIKYIWFNSTFLALYFIFKSIIQIDERLKSIGFIVLIIAAAEIFFYIYDYVFTKFIMFFKRRVMGVK